MNYNTLGKEGNLLILSAAMSLIRNILSGWIQSLAAFDITGSSEEAKTLKIKVNFFLH